MYDPDAIYEEFNDDYEFDDFDEFEGDFDDDEMDWDDEFDDDDDEVTELAMELMSVSDDEELEQFLPSIVRRVIGPLIPIIGPPSKRALRHVFSKGRHLIRRVVPYGRHYARKAWPYIKKYGKRYGPWVGPLPWELYKHYKSSKKEFDDDADEMQLEVAKNVVRIIRTAAKKAVKATQAGVPPDAAAAKAIKAAVKKHAPSLIKKEMYYHPQYGRRHPRYPRHRSGRWVKRGRNLIAVGAY